MKESAYESMNGLIKKGSIFKFVCGWIWKIVYESMYGWILEKFFVWIYI